MTCSDLLNDRMGMILKVCQSYMMFYLVSHSKIAYCQLFHIINLIILHKLAFFLQLSLGGFKNC